MKKSIYLFGAGGLGREIAAMIAALPEWKLVGFYDDHKPPSQPIDGFPVLGNLQDLLRSSEPRNVVVALGDPKIKKTVVDELMKNKKIGYPVLVHPSSIIMDTTRVSIGNGSVIGAGCILTTGIVVGEHVLLNLNCTVGHDVRIGDYSSVMPGVNLAGAVTIGDAVLIGSGAQVINGISVGSGARVGSGAVVTKPVEESTTVAGVPAQRIK